MRRHINVAALFAVLACVGQAAAQKNPTPAVDVSIDWSTKVIVGDMVLERPRLMVDGNGTFSSAQGALLIGYQSEPWPFGVLPIVFADNISTERRGLFMHVCRGWERDTGVRCVPRTNEGAYVDVRMDFSASCMAGVGKLRQEGGIMNLHDGCWNERTIYHELGHAIGMTHEHSRSDRDAFITVDFSNIQAAHVGQYTKVVTHQVRSQYDFDSVMHYQDRAYAIDSSKPTMVPLGQYASQAARMGQATQPSELDRQAVALMYRNLPPPYTPPAPLTPGQLRFDRFEFLRAMNDLDLIYMTELKRENGLSYGTEPDLLGIATWIFDIYLTSRVAGLTDGGALNNVIYHIQNTDEWRVKNPDRQPQRPLLTFFSWRLDRGEYLNAMYKLSEAYKVELLRPEGLSIDGRPDFLGIAAWIFDIYLNARLGGSSPDQAWAAVLASIRASDEWRSKH